MSGNTLLQILSSFCVIVTSCIISDYNIYYNISICSSVCSSVRYKMFVCDNFPSIPIKGTKGKLLNEIYIFIVSFVLALVWIVLMDLTFCTFCLTSIFCLGLSFMGHSFCMFYPFYTFYPSLLV